MAKDKQPDSEPKPLRKCAACGANTFEVKHLVQVRGTEQVNGYDEVRCVVCGKLLAPAGA